MRFPWLMALALGAAHCVGGDYSLGGGEGGGGGTPRSQGGAGKFEGGDGGRLEAAGGSAENAGAAGRIFGDAGAGGAPGATVPETAGAGAGPAPMAGGGADGGANHGAGGTLGDGGIGLGGDAGADGSVPLGCEAEVVTRCLRVWDLETVGGSGASDDELPALFPHPSVVTFTNSILNAINASGTIVGARTCKDAPLRAARFENRAAHDLLTDIETQFSEAVDINDDGVVVGHLKRPMSNFPTDPFTHQGAYHAFVWKDGVTRVLEELGPVKVIAINNRGQVLLQRTSVDEAHAVLCEQQRCGVARGLLWQDGQITDIGTLGGASTQPYALDDAGRVLALTQRAGSQLPTDRFVPALFENGVLRQLPLSEYDQIDMSDDGEIGVGLGLWNGSEVVQRGPDVEVLSALLRSHGSTIGTYRYLLEGNFDGDVARPFVFTADHFVPLWGVVGGRTFTSGVVSDANEHGVIIGEGATNKLYFSGGAQAEYSTPTLSSQAVVWSPDCYHGCCSPIGAGGAGFGSDEGGGGSATLEGRQL